MLLFAVIYKIQLYVVLILCFVLIRTEFHFLDLFVLLRLLFFNNLISFISSILAGDYIFSRYRTKQNSSFFINSSLLTDVVLGKLFGKYTECKSISFIFQTNRRTIDYPPLAMGVEVQLSSSFTKRFFFFQHKNHIRGLFNPT